MLLKNHIDANKGKIKELLYLEDNFGFCKSFKKVTRGLGFHVVLKGNDLQDILDTYMGDDISVTIDNLYLFIPNLIPTVETQLMFNEATQNIYKISFDEWYTERRIISDMVVQVDIGSAQQVKSPKCLICAHQTKNRIDSPNKNKNFAIFDHLNLQKHYVEIDGQGYPRDSLLINYEQNDCIEQYKNL